MLNNKKLSSTTLIILIFVSLLLFWLIMKWFSFLIKNYYIIDNIKKEGYSNAMTHSVDLPINTRLSCSNFCGPKGTCAITQEQCLADIDCYGCQPIKPSSQEQKTINLEPYFGSGRLIYNQNPQYSKLTTDIGTQSYIYNKDAKTPKMFLGIDKWTKSFNYGLDLEDDKLTYQYSAAPEPYRFVPTYPITETATGLFYDTGPTPSNAYL
jgi:hypothetical protein